MMDLLADIENGRQRGHSTYLKIDSAMYLCGAAIQKYEDRYKVHIYQIMEQKMAAEDYDFCHYKDFLTIEEAMLWINQNSRIKFEEFRRLKGQKMFNPALDK